MVKGGKYMSKIFVICGHGAGDSGACGNGFTEAERVRTLGKRIAAIGGDSVLLGDVNRDYYADNGISNLNISKDYQIIELHMDSNDSPSPKGAHIIIKTGFSPDKYDTALANFLSGMFPGRANAIVGRDDLANPNRAAIKGYSYRLAECGFISNPNDVSTFNSRMDDIAKGILQCFDIEVSGNVPTQPDPPPTKPSDKPSSGGGLQNLGKVDLFYRAKTSKWWDEVINTNDWAGQGDDSPITAIAMRASVGSVKYRVHAKGGNWFDWVTGYNLNDHNNGYAGDGQTPIDAIQAIYYTPDGYNYKYLHYKISPQGMSNYYPAQIDDQTTNNQDGYAGVFGRYIDKFQAWIE